MPVTSARLLISVLGHRIRYWDEGQGDPLVLGSATYEWAPVFAPLAKHRRVVALQVIGFAPSEHPDTYEIARMAILRDSGLARREPTRHALAQISVPTLLLWGEKDALIPLACGQDAATRIPNAELVVLSDVGHIPSIEATDDFIRIVGEFADR